MRHSDSGPVVSTIPALAGFVYGLAAAVQFLDAEISIGVLDYTFAPAHALIVSLLALVVVFASSDTRNWGRYDGWEQAVVAVAIGVMLAHQYFPLVTIAIENNQPHLGIAAFLSGMFAWVVLSR